MRTKISGLASLTFICTALPTLASAQTPCTTGGLVLSHQKISDTEGGFTGMLDDFDVFGSSIASIGDLDGDGANDLAVGAHDDDGGNLRGAVWVLFLNGDGTVKSHQKISDNAGGFVGILDDGDFFGSSVASLGDLDGDGVGDLAVGALGDGDGGPNTGAVWILFLNDDGTVKSHQKISDILGGFTGILDDFDLFGWSVASIGDLDGDGTADLAVGALLDDDGGFNNGAVWILFLNNDGTVKAHQKISRSQGGFTGILQQNDEFGVSVASIGDLDGDGVTDLAVGATGDDDGGFDNGAVWILFLNDDGTVKSHAKISDTEGGFTGSLVLDDVFGSSVASIGDLDGDGVADLAVGATGDDDGGFNRGAVWMLFLNDDGTVKSHQKISDTEGGFTGILDNGDRFGSSVASVGDLDGDGMADLAVGADFDDDGGSGSGAVWVLFLAGRCSSDLVCDDGLFCNGQEYCFDFAGCQFGPPPCNDLSAPVCLEEVDSCVPSPTFSVELAEVNGVDVGSAPSNTSTVPVGALLTVEVFVRDWSPVGQQLDSYQLTIDSVGYTSGSFGNIYPRDWSATTDVNGCSSGGPPGDPNDDNAFIDVDDCFSNQPAPPGEPDPVGSDIGPWGVLNPCTFFEDCLTGGPCDGPSIDWVHGGISQSNISLVVESDVCDYRFGNTLSGGAAGRVSDEDGSKFYVGTVVLRVSNDAEGVFTICLDDTDMLPPFADPDNSFLRDEDSDPIFPVAFECLQLTIEDCNDDLDCNDGLFCNGEESCQFNECFTVTGTVPCEGQICLEDSDQCADCIIDSNCNDGLFCTGVETCVDGTCASTGNLCPGGQACDEATDECFACLEDIDCGDNIFCNGTETCDFNGICQCGPNPCPGQQCDEIVDQCLVNCFFDADCADGDPCSIDECVDGECQHTAVDCSELDDQCNVGVCNSESGECEADPLPPPAVGAVLSHQKISDTQGGFTGTLDDVDVFGSSVAAIGDLDGDGVGDLAVGARFDDDGGVGKGAVWILFLNSDGTVKAHQKISDTEGGFTGMLDDLDNFGSSVAAIGDLDGDAVTDLAVGAVLDDVGGGSRGAVWVLFLNDDGTVKAHQKISQTEGGFTGDLDQNDRFGASIASIGDLDGDGVADLAVGAREDDDGGNGRGAIWVLFLNDDGTVKSHQKISNTEGGFTGILDNFDFFGSSVASIGDLDADGASDLAVGAIGDDDGGTDRGAVWVLFLNDDGTVKSQQKISDTAGGFAGMLDIFDQFGSSVASIGDLDADGVTDLAVGAFRDDDGDTDRGAVWVMFLNGDGTVKSHLKISDTAGGFTGMLDDFDQFGISVASIGDLDGDGASDLAVGAYFDDDGGFNRGAVWVLFLAGGQPLGCDDGLFCNGEESCEDGECVSTGDPCPQDSICDEDQDVCINTGACCDCDCAGLVCEETTFQDCEGEFAGLGTTCAGGCDDVVTCTPEGACCFCDEGTDQNGCNITTETGCGAADGSYQGDCTECDANGTTCDEDTVGSLCSGHCCVCAGSRCERTQVSMCEDDIAEEDCADLGGTFNDGACEEDSCVGECPECVDNADCPFGPCIDVMCGGEGPCGCCAGKVTDLCLVNGGDTGVITVKAKGGIVFEGNVASGETFCFGPHEGQSTLGKKIDVCQNVGCSGSGSGSGSGFCAGGCKTKIKTDCKKHIGPGDVFGDFTVESGSSLLGGPLCPDGEPACASGSGSNVSGSDD